MEWEKILEVGSGSWWTVALLGYIVGKMWRVYWTELEAELVKWSKNNIKKSELKNIEIYRAKKIFGYPEEAPYDRILVSAAAQEIPQELLAQLKIGGIMVIPIKHSIYRIRKNSENDVEYENFYGFSFVPLIG